MLWVTAYQACHRMTQDGPERWQDPEPGGAIHQGNLVSGILDTMLDQHRKLWSSERKRHRKK